MIRDQRFGKTAAIAFLFVLALPSSAKLEEDSTIQIGDAQIQMEIADGDWGLAKEGIPRWVRSAGESVAAYYGHFPLQSVRVKISPFQGDGVRHGMTFGDHGGYIIIRVGNNTTPAEFGTDWTLTHEMVHLSFPSIEDDHHWIEEGIATYVEPIARVQAAHMDSNEMWFELVRDLPQGLPGPGDKGLDQTHTWANTYWGGALFCFLADVEIRRATENRKGLQDALIGILNAGGDIRASWDLRKALETGDNATGTTVLVDLYGKMKDQPFKPDLAQMWRDLGVIRNSNTVVFDDKAPLADVRRAITSGKSDKDQS